MELLSLIRDAEECWLTAYEEYAASVFSSTHLPSHDENHHRRVWQITRKILPELASNGLSFDHSKVEALMAAVYFHDLGMASHPGPDHGPAGRRLCEAWFRGQGKFSGFEEMLDAIEGHDDKEARTVSGQQPVSIMAILGLADDMDALGIIGIYRYAEIYLLRDTPLKELGTAILRNAAARYSKMTKYFPHMPSLSERLKEEYRILCAFWSLYNQQLCSLKDPEFTDRGHLGIINFIRGPGIEGRLKPGALQRVSGGRKCSVAHAYFIELKKQLENEAFA